MNEYFSWIIFKNTLVISSGVYLIFKNLKSYVENKFYHFGSQHLDNKVMGKKDYVFLMFSTNALIVSSNIFWKANIFFET